MFMEGLDAATAAFDVGYERGESPGATTAAILYR
jgi:hypothetical protein